MSADSTHEGPKAQPSRRSFVGNVAFGAGLVVVLATMTLGAFAGVMLTSDLAKASLLSTVVPDDGHTALMVGAIALGGITGLMLPVILLGMVRGSGDKPRIGPGAAVRKVLAVLAFDVYLLLVAILVSQLGWILPKGATTLVAVFAVGFSWMPLAMVPWEKLGLGGTSSPRRTAKCSWVAS
ncbi:hypothetical protein [Streptomyces sp. NPDC020298]|uniref:hypothetical protein n=1 Tax=unclassified Streptomyces TaxID=2593676 RepID=UPI0033E02057